MNPPHFKNFKETDTGNGRPFSFQYQEYLND